MSEFCINRKSSEKDRFPTKNGELSDESILEYGEIAVNYSKGNEFLAIRNNNEENGNNTAIFRPWSYIEANIKSNINNSYKTVFIFTSSDSKPNKPEGGNWDNNTNQFTAPDGWYRSDEGLNAPIWMSTGEQLNRESNFIWSDPIKITGEDGQNGKDGTSVEYIYRLTQDNSQYPSTPTESKNENNYIPYGWTDSPSGISEEFQVEWVCTRKRINNQWDKWEGPTIWSKWGVNGMDGDSIEYIYKLTKGERPDTPLVENFETDETYQSTDTEYIPYGWTDGPSGVTSEYTHEWVSMRKYTTVVTDNGVKTKKWGAFNTPSIWAMYGQKGDVGPTGVSIRSMYLTSKSSNADNIVVNKNNINPGSGWSISIPSMTSVTDNYLWEIWTYINSDGELATITQLDSENNVVEIHGWQGPILKSGIPGKNGVAPNWKIYFYKLSDVQPQKPTFTNIDVSDTQGWKDYPEGQGQWWQCIGSVDGTTNQIKEWTDPFPLNAVKDGNTTEFRFALYYSRTYIPPYSKAKRDPSIDDVVWRTETVSTGTSLPYVWMTNAVIDANNNLVEEWKTPICISGEKGVTGDRGPAGKDGTSIMLKYCLGTATEPDIKDEPTENDNKGWLEELPQTTIEKPYVWCIQGVPIYDKEGKQTTVKWGKPFILSGLQTVIDNITKRGQIVYPAGLYDKNVTYETTDRKAPYVLDSDDGCYYVLNTIMEWVGNEQPESINTPSKDYIINKGNIWQKLEDFKAIYASVGIIDNGKIGSAVFNGDFMFSQNGLDKEGNKTNAYSGFSVDNNSNPYYDGAEFIPAWCVNLNDGTQWCSHGKIKFSADGSSFLGNSGIEIDKSGNLFENVVYKKTLVKDADGCYVLPKLMLNDSFQMYSIPFVYGNGNGLNGENPKFKFKVYDTSVKVSINNQNNVSGFSNIIFDTNKTTPEYKLQRKGCGEVVCMGLNPESNMDFFGERWIIGVNYYQGFEDYNYYDKILAKIDESLKNITTKINNNITNESDKLPQWNEQINGGLFDDFIDWPKRDDILIT